MNVNTLLQPPSRWDERDASAGNPTEFAKGARALVIFNQNSGTDFSSFVRPWLQGRIGGIWYDLPLDRRLRTSLAGGDVSAAVDQRNTDADGQSDYASFYDHVPIAAVRAPWASTTPGGVGNDSTSRQIAEAK